MGRARVQKQNVKLFLLSQELLVPVSKGDFSKSIFLGEVDSFSAKSRTKIVISRGVGYINEGATEDYGGWDLSFSAGKVDWDMAYFYWLKDQTLRAGNQPPNFMLIEEIWHYNGAYEQYIYKNCSFFGLDLSRSDEITESISGFSPVRKLGTKDDTFIHDPVGMALKQTMFRVNASNTSLSEFSKNMDNVERNY